MNAYASRCVHLTTCALVMWLTTQVAQAQSERSVEIEAKTLVSQIVAGDFETAHGSFAPEVSDKLNIPALRSTWASVTAQLGGFQTQLGTSSQRAGSYTKVRVSCLFARMKMDIEVVYNTDRKVVGFFIRPPMPKLKTVARPQTPKPPFPYESIEVDYPSLGDAGRFGGTLTRPRNVSAAPAVLLITGSGLQDRDETLFGHKPFAVLADHLTRSGFIVLRVDDRSVGKTTVSSKGATIQKHAEDVLSGFTFLQRQSGVDPKRVGLLGHSEGGLLAAMVASTRPDVAFIVMLGAAGLSGEEINPLQVEAALKARPGIATESIKAIVVRQRRLMQALKNGAKHDELVSLLKSLQGESVKLAPPAARSRLTPELLQAEIDAQLKAITSPWFRSFVSTDPGPVLQAVRCPVLALIGSKDLQVPAAPNLKAIRGALKAGKNSRAEVDEVSGVNHLFQRAKTGAISEYSKIDETINSAVLKRVGAWLRANVAVKNPE